MATYKNVSNDYIITVNDGAGNVIINGNLNVEGNVTYIETTELEVLDPFIILNVSNTPGNINSYYSNSGILTHKTSSDYAGLRFNKNTGNWEISASTGPTGETGSWSPIVSGIVGAAGNNTQIQYNDNGNFGANANFTFDSTTSKFTLQGHEVLGNIGVAPMAVSNSVAVYHNAIGGGGTGLYVKSAIVEQEVVSKNRAIVFGIIF
jgi:hypothetical protein